MPRTDYSKLRDIVHTAINRYNYAIRKTLIDYGFKDSDADRFLYDVGYNGYIDSLIATT